MEAADWWVHVIVMTVNSSSPWSLRAYCAQRGPCWYVVAREGARILVWWSLLLASSCWKLPPPFLSPSVCPFIHPSARPSIHSPVPYIFIAVCYVPGPGDQRLTRQVQPSQAIFHGMPLLRSSSVSCVFIWDLLQERELMLSLPLPWWRQRADVSRRLWQAKAGSGS